MRLDIYIHDGREDQILARLDRIQSQFATLMQQETQEVAEIDDLKTAIENEKTVEESAIALLDGLTQKVNTLVQNATDLATLKSEITDLTSTVTSDSDALAAAVTANTPAAPPE